MCGADRAEQPAQARGTAPTDELECLALRRGQAAPLALRVAHSSQAGERVARKPVIGDLVDPVSRAPLRHGAIDSRRQDDQRHSGQREGRLPHEPRTTLQIQFHPSDDIATMAPNCGVAMNHCAAYQIARKNGHWRVLMLLIARRVTGRLASTSPWCRACAGAGPLPPSFGVRYGS